MRSHYIWAFNICKLFKIGHFHSELDEIRPAYHLEGVFH